MLESLVIQDFVLIDKLSLSVSKGLNVFTGETGAGKSILLDALGLALGARSDAGMIRQGAKQASVAAHFTGPFSRSLTTFLDDQGLNAPDDLLILRRTIGSDGKSRAFVNDIPVSATTLRTLGTFLLEVHGQFDTHGLLDASTHLDLLDAFGGLGAESHTLAEAWHLYRAAETKREEREKQAERAKAEEDYLRASLSELNDLAPKAGETEKLAELRAGLQNREKTVESLRSAQDALSGDRGAMAALQQAGKAVARLAAKSAGFEPLLALIDQAAADATEADDDVSRRLSALESPAETLESIEERLFALRAIARKHTVDPSALADLATSLAEKLALIENEDDTRRALAKKVEAAKKTYLDLAKRLGDKRRKAARKLEIAILKELAPLKLEKARFMVDFTPLDLTEAGPRGLDRATFLIAANPGSPPGPLHKIASGGELARFMLALKVVLAAETDPIGTLVFDEVDTGISGATASAVGERLQRLGESFQVLVVTHSPQVAARGGVHFLVSKETETNCTTTKVEKLSKADRVREIGRLLSGHKTTKAALEAAKSLLDTFPLRRNRV